MKTKENYLEKNRSHLDIRNHGAIGHLNEGIEIELNGLSTRLIAWPGNGYQTESVHVITVQPGKESSNYNYPISEEALFCVEGKGEVFLHDQWVTLAPGDIAYFPENIKHAIRNHNKSDFILVSSITPPLVSLYESSGFYIREIGKMDFDAVNAAKKIAKPGNMSTKNFLQYRETEPDLRAWQMEIADIRQKGALFNVFRGAEFDANGSPMRFVLWPGYGQRLCGFHLTRCAPGDIFAAHTHPISDECVIVWAGLARGFLDGHWFPLATHECLLAPCGVQHGGPLNVNMETKDVQEVAGDTLWGGFASPPQGDLYLRGGYIKSGISIETPPFVRFKNQQEIK